MICTSLELKRHCHLASFQVAWCSLAGLLANFESNVSCERQPKALCLATASPSVSTGMNRRAGRHHPWAEQQGHFQEQEQWTHILGSAAQGRGPPRLGAGGSMWPRCTALSAIVCHAWLAISLPGEAWREAGECDSVTLIPRPVAEIVCCEPQGHAGRGGRPWHLLATCS